jgi:glycerophosphoryl diester phosphodiesterase
VGSARTRCVVGLGIVASVLAYVAEPAAAERTIGTPYIQAHRGGAVVNSEPIYPENTMPAFRHSAAEGFVLEMDVKLTMDRVPVIMHDATLDRTTDCTGEVASKTLAQLRHCRVDILGSEGNSRHINPNSSRSASIPTLAHVLAFIKREGTQASIEIKNVPTDPDFDPTDAFATTVSRAIRSSRVPQSRLIIQSFWPPNLTVAQRILPGAELSFLTLSAANTGGITYASSHGIRWVSPQWPVDAAYIANAHAQGREIVPYTVDKRSDMVAAANDGVDAIITNDPTRARRVFHQTEPPAPPMPPPPGKGECRTTRAGLHAPPIKSLDPAPGAPRVFAMQFKQAVANVTSYGAFRTKIECMIRQYVVPHLAKHRPNVVAFNEDVGLMTLGTGSRGAVARETIGRPDSVPSCAGKPAPCVAAVALGQITAAYGQQVAAYRGRFPEMGALAQSFVAPTDTFARGWMQTFSDMARRYGIYIVGSNTQAPFRESRDPSEIDTFRDPDIADPASVFVATGPEVYNQVFMWGPHTVHKEGPLPLRNVVATNQKVPLTSFEETLQVSNGPSSGPDGRANLKPFHVPHTKAKIGFATSLPAFEFGYDYGDSPPSVKPCKDIATTYMRCLSALGTNVVIQDEANDAQWAGLGGGGAWQPLEWMGSSWRDVTDTGVGIDYNVTPFMVGNLADLVFDGQSSIAQRPKAQGRGCNYIGNRHLMPGPPENDPADFRPYAGRKRQFLGLARWVVPGSSDRDRLRATAADLAPGSGSPLENDYLETALVADLPFPPDAHRPACARGVAVDVTNQGK